MGMDNRAPFPAPALVIIMDTSLTTMPDMSAGNRRILHNLRAQYLEDKLIDKYNAKLLVCDTPEELFKTIRENPGRVKVVLIDKNIDLADKSGVKRISLKGANVKELLGEQFPDISTAVISYDRVGVDFHKTNLEQDQLHSHVNNPLRNWLAENLEKRNVPGKPAKDYDAVRRGVRPAMRHVFAACAQAIEYGSGVVKLTCEGIDNPGMHHSQEFLYLSEDSKKRGIELAEAYIAMAQRLRNYNDDIPLEDIAALSTQWRHTCSAEKLDADLWKSEHNQNDNMMSHDYCNFLQGMQNSLVLAEGIIYRETHRERI